jgi:hypothetical protein
MISKTTVGQKLFKVAVFSNSVTYQEYTALKDKEYGEEDFGMVPLHDKEEKMYWVDKDELFASKKEANKFAIAHLKGLRKELLKKTRVINKTIDKCLNDKDRKKA